MAFLRSNFGYAFLSVAIDTDDTAIVVAGGHFLPAVSGSFRAVIWDFSTYTNPSSDPYREIVTGSYTSSNHYTITRAQEGTAASNHSAGAKIGVTYTAGVSEDDLLVLGTKYVDEAALADDSCLIYDSSSGKIIYTPRSVFSKVRPTLTLQYTGDTGPARFFSAASASGGRADISTNLYYDGAAWQRDDIGSASSLISVSNGTFNFRRCAAGANPATLISTLLLNADRTITAGGYGAGASIFDLSGNISSVAPSTSGNVLTSNGITWISSTPAASTTILSAVYPIGSVYISVVSTSPATLFGFGTWAAFATGRTLVGIDANQAEFNTVEETGGATTHALSEAEMPAHKHISGSAEFNSNSAYGVAPSGPAGNINQQNETTGDNHAYTSTTGSGSAHNNLQPYIVVYMWKRTA